MPGSSACPFCERIIAGGVEHRLGSAVAFPDCFPLSPGHMLVVPARHEVSFFALSETEQTDLWHLLSEIRRRLQERLSPDGFNIGINDGAAAGQTMSHAHVHVIPRFLGDVLDPRGGVRWVIPLKAAYWAGESGLTTSRRSHSGFSSSSTRACSSPPTSLLSCSAWMTCLRKAAGHAARPLGGLPRRI